MEIQLEANPRALFEKSGLDGALNPSSFCQMKMPDPEALVAWVPQRLVPFTTFLVWEGSEPYTEKKLVPLF